MSVRNLHKILKPRRIALMCTIEERLSLGLTVLRNLLGAGFQGVVYPVNAELESIDGIPTYPTLASLPHTPDLALISTPAASVPANVRQCGEVGIRGIVILSGGFRETGEEGRRLEQQIADAACEFDGLRIIGPNSLGFIAPHLGLNASHAGSIPKQGHLAFISESRALCNSMIDWATDAGIGFSHFVSIGNMLDVGFGELIDYFGNDPNTRAIILYLQSLEHARSFRSAARAFARSKPIVAYKAGRFAESAQAAASHTGSMVAEDAVYEAAFQRAGIVRVMDLDDVFDVAELLASKRLPEGSRLAIVSNAGGPAVIAADALLARGGTLAELEERTRARLRQALPPMASHVNPVDLLDSAPPERFAEALTIVAEDSNVDAALVIFATQTNSGPRRTARAVAEVVKGLAKPVLAAWMGAGTVREGIQILNEAGLATHSTPEQAVRAFVHLVSYAKNLESLYETPREVSVHFDLNRRKVRKRLQPVLTELSGRLTTQQAEAFLKAYQIPIADSGVAHTRAEAIAIADRIGYPVALKVISPKIIHKVEVGAVALDLKDFREVYNAYEHLLGRAQFYEFDAEVKGMLVQKMVTPENSIELIVGAKRDPTFGPIIMVGMGGTATELHSDRALGLPPLNERLTRRMLESLRSWPMFTGYRGQPPVNVDALIETIIRFSYLVTDYPEIREFEINPLLVAPEEVTALDVLGFFDPADTAAATSAEDPYHHLAIQPYPEEYVRRATTKTGVVVTLRPVKPEDEPQWHKLLQSSSSESIHFRFHSFFHESTHEMAVQYCVIDYEREIAIVAETEVEGERELVGIAHLLADANHENAEFGVIVPDPWQGQGLGGMLLDYCLQLATRWGIKCVVADVRLGNKPMLATFQKRGFSSEVDYGEETVYLEKRLEGHANPETSTDSETVLEF